MARDLTVIQADIVHLENEVDKWQKRLDAQKERRRIAGSLKVISEKQIKDAINLREDSSLLSMAKAAGLRVDQIMDIDEHQRNILNAEEAIEYLDPEIKANESLLNALQEKLNVLRLEEQNNAEYQTQMAEKKRIEQENEKEEEEERLRLEKAKNDREYQELKNRLSELKAKPFDDTANSAEYTSRINALDNIVRDFRALPGSYDVAAYIQECESCRRQCEDRRTAAAEAERIEAERKVADEKIARTIIIALLVIVCGIVLAMSLINNPSAAKQTAAAAAPKPELSSDLIAQLCDRSGPVIKNGVAVNIQARGQAARMYRVAYADDWTVISIERTDGSHREIQLAEPGSPDAYFIKDLASGKKFDIRGVRNFDDSKTGAGADLIFDAICTRRFNMIEGNTGGKGWHFYDITVPE